MFVPFLGLRPMIKYVPFLKMKQNEIQAVVEVKNEILDKIIPFFDVPRPKQNSELEIRERIRIAKKCAEANLSEIKFYLDNFDTDESVLIDGVAQYEFILRQFEKFSIIPVAGLYRDSEHNAAAIRRSASMKGQKVIALRLTSQDIESYKLTKSELVSVYDEFDKAELSEVHLILDHRVITGDAKSVAENSMKFISQFQEDFEFHKVIFAGSSIPANVADILKSKTEATIQRKEFSAWIELNAGASDIPWVFGDYGLVSPDYTDMEFDFRIVQNIATPKVFYTYQGHYFAVRGGSFKSHPKKYGQYFSIADVIVEKPFFRKRTFSFGEGYIIDRSVKAIKKATRPGSPSSWLKATLASHMTFVVSEFSSTT